MTRERATDAMLWVALGLPVFLSFNYVYRFGVSVPYWDEWSVVGNYLQWLDGTLTLEALDELANEHRVLFPRVVLLLVARVTSYDVHAMMYAGWLTLAVAGVLLFREHLSTFGRTRWTLAAWVPSAWLVFNVHQHENLLWAWQMTFFLCLTSAVGAFVLLAQADRGRWQFPAAAALGAVSSFSLAAGLAVWIAGTAQLLAGVLLASKAERRRPLLRLVAWVGVGGVTGALYAWGYQPVTGLPQQPSFFESPWRMVRHVLISMGTPITADTHAGFVVGGALCVALVLFAVALRKGALDARKAVFGLPLVVFGAVFAAMVSLGRGAWGDGSALNSRYVTLGMLFGLGVVRIGSALTLPAARWAGAGALGVAAAFILHTFFDLSYREGFASKARRQEAAQVLREHASRPDADLKRLLYFDVPKLRQRAARLEAARLNVFK